MARFGFCAASFFVFFRGGGGGWIGLLFHSILSKIVASTIQLLLLVTANHELHLSSIPTDNARRRETSNTLLTEQQVLRFIFRNDVFY